MAIQVRRGNEADFDPSNMLPGEWAVSLDTKYVRMCFSSGICLRMATYEAFEADMAEIRNILAEARTIEEAVARIQTEINDTAIVVEDYAILSKSYAVGGTGTRENEDIDNAKYYYEQAKHISQGGNGLVPLGTIAFENLPTENILTNAMYNISNDFTSDERFLDGGGILYGKGSNVFYTVDGKWDVLAASDVKGIKGEAEDTFRQGNVNITKGNIGLENVDNTSDADKPISNKQQAEFDRIDSLLGNTDISAIGDGTITGAVSTLNNNLGQLIRIVEGTLPDTTGDYTIAYVIPDSYIPIKAYYLTDFNQWRNLNIGYFGSILVITDSTSNNVNRPYRLVCLKI